MAAQYNTSSTTLTTVLRLVNSTLKVLETKSPSTTTATTTTVTTTTISRSSSQRLPWRDAGADDVTYDVVEIADGGGTTADVTPGVTDSLSSSAYGVAIGVAIAVVILLIIIVAIIFLLFRRRRLRRRDKGIVKIENPQYKFVETEERGATLSTAPTVKFNANNNAALISGTSNSRKRKEAPAPPIYRPPPSENNKKWDSLTKRKGQAPPPPTNGLELYAKDSPSASTENINTGNMTSAVNVHAVSPVDDSSDLQTETSHMQPLIGETNKVSPKKEFKFGSPKKNVSSTRDDDDDNMADADAKASLIGKKAGSNMSLDSYDRTKNPFFTD